MLIFCRQSVEMERAPGLQHHDGRPGLVLLPLLLASLFPPLPPPLCFKLHPSLHQSTFYRGKESQSDLSKYLKILFQYLFFFGWPLWGKLLKKWLLSENVKPSKETEENKVSVSKSGDEKKED